jgi:Ca2+-binding RTX toxin-like protein/subtilisin-like proprotein convertase family protein
MILALRPNDPLYNSQWHLAMIGRLGPAPVNNTVGIERVWANYTGDSVRVGVWDDGIQATHWDLTNNYNANLQVTIGGTLNNGQPLTANDGHGTSVGGLIAADNNGLGGVGVAYDAQLTAIRIFGGADDINANWARYLQTLDALSQFDVTNHSYGGAPDFNLAGDVEKFAQAAAIGRGGLGTVHVKSAGNSNIDGNGDALDSSRYTVTVAAIDNIASGAITSYSTYGSHVLVSAPAGSVTTDLLGNSAGYNGLLNGDYTNGFGGTSAAGPITAGAVALVLDANPLLGWRDVQNILSYSAIGVGSLYSGSSQNENFTWKWNGASNWNGGGLHYSEDYGYGMINVWSMVRMAEVWSEFFPAPATSSNEVSATTGVINVNRNIADLSTLNYSFTVDQNISLEHVSLTTTLSHSFFTDLRIRLISPDGTVMTLYNGTSGNAGTSASGFSYAWGIDGLRGELSAGSWTLQIQDAVSADTGVLQSIQWTGFGSTVSNDNVYHYTDEAISVQSLTNQGYRTNLQELDGGSDWINASATSSDLYLNLNDGHSSTLGATYFLTVAEASMIENAIGGDGNDYLIGNELNNQLYGMRGDDRIVGGGGVDTVVFLDSKDNYQITQNGHYLQVTSLLDGSSDTLYGVEWIRFADETMAVSLADFIDNLAPIEVGYSPADDSQAIAIDSVLKIIFDEEIQKGSGAINIYQANNVLWKSIQVTSSEIQVQANTLFIDPIENFSYGNNYSVRFDAGAIKDLGNNSISEYTSSLNFQTGADLSTITGTNLADNLSGNAFNNRILGLAGNDTLSDLLGGNDYLDGGLGSDRMSGGIGNDTYIVDATGDVVTEAANAGLDEVRSSVTYTLTANVENLTLLGTANINGTGNALANLMIGNVSANTLNGGAGMDTLAGGNGNDTYVVDNIGDVVTELANGGLDHVQSSVRVSGMIADDPVAAWIGDAVENITLTGNAAINATGNSLNNTIIGNSAANVLIGGDGNDLLNGGLGRDTLVGGSGIDFFIFNTALGNNNVDTITNFSAVDDFIHLENAILRSLTTAGALNPNNFVTGTRALDNNDFIIFNPANGALSYDADGSGRTAAIQFASLIGVTGTVSASDFFVI